MPVCRALSHATSSASRAEPDQFEPVDPAALAASSQVGTTQNTRAAPPHGPHALPAIAAGLFAWVCHLNVVWEVKRSWGVQGVRGGDPSRACAPVPCLAREVKR